MPTVIDENGKVYGLFADVPTGVSSFEEFVFVVDGGVVSATIGFSYGTSIDGSITIFSLENGSENCCPEVLDWLCRNYGLSFSPEGLYVFGSDGTVENESIASAYCLDSAGVYVLGSHSSGYTLLTPSGNYVLGCNGSPVEYYGGIGVPSALLRDIRSVQSDLFKPAYNTWLFYLASGLPKSVFDNGFARYFKNDNGEQVLIAGAGDDYIGLDGTHFVTLRDYDGGLFAVVSYFGYDTDVRRVLYREGNVLKFTTRSFNADVLADFFSICSGNIFDVDLADAEFPNIDVTYWLMRNYGFTFNPVGLPLWGEGSGTEPLASVSSAACWEGTFTLFDGEQSFALQYPFGQNEAMLGCDGSPSNLGEQTDIISAYIDKLSAGTFALRKPAFNTWVFWLASGLDESLFVEP